MNLPRRAREGLEGDPPPLCEGRVGEVIHPVSDNALLERNDKILPALCRSGFKISFSCFDEKEWKDYNKSNSFMEEPNA